MKTLQYLLFASLILMAIDTAISQQVGQGQYFQPTFQSLEKANPVPEWFKDAKFGIYFHWGVYSVPAYANEWYPRNMYAGIEREQTSYRKIW
jgi:hypothetical protein